MGHSGRVANVAIEAPGAEATELACRWLAEIAVSGTIGHPTSPADTYSAARLRQCAVSYRLQRSDRANSAVLAPSSTLSKVADSSNAAFGAP